MNTKELQIEVIYNPFLELLGINMEKIKQAILYIGPLRAMLYTLVIVIIVLSQFTGDKAVYTGWAIIPTLIIPAIAPIVFFGFLLELLMSSVFMTDTEETRTRTRFKNIIKIDLVLLAGLVLAWSPYFSSLGS